MYLFEKIQPKDYKQYQSLLQDCPINSSISYVLDKNMDIFLNNSISNRSVYVSKTNENILGSFLMTKEEYYLHGQKIFSGYLGLLRIFNEKKHNISLLKDGYRKLAEEHVDPQSFFYTVISSDNIEAKKLLASGLSFVPSYNYINDITTFCISKKCQKKQKNVINECNSGIFLEFYNKWCSNFDFSMVLNKAKINSLNAKYFIYRKNETTVATFALVDTDKESSVYAKHYNQLIQKTFKLINCGLNCLNYPKLPKLNEKLNHSFMSFFVHDGTLTEDDFLSIIHGLLQFTKKENLSFTTFNDGNYYKWLNSNFRSLKMKSSYYTVYNKVEDLKNKVVEGFLL